MERLKVFSKIHKDFVKFTSISYDEESKIKAINAQYKGDRYSLKPESCEVLMFSGLYDKLGNPIFDKDILRTKSIGEGVVSFKDGAFIVNFNNRVCFDNWEYQLRMCNKHSEVVGNSLTAQGEKEIS